jgi:hypothetical protein
VSNRARLLVTACVCTALGAAPASAQQTHALVVAGLGGAAQYRQSFLDWSVELQTALVQKHGLPPVNVTVLAETPEASPSIADRSTRANVMKVLGEIAQRAGPQDRLLVVLIGHGTTAGGETRFNLPGPDLTPGDFAAGLVAFPTQTLALVHTGSGSGAFVEPLSGPNRIIVTATRSARELNATEFARFFVEAVTGDGADLDKDRRVSLLEAFEYANLEVARYYDEENELLTEHAVLDDNGDGEGSRRPIRDGEDGPLAATFHFASGAVAATGGLAPATDDPVLAQLFQDRVEINDRIGELRGRRDSMRPDAYEDALEELLVELALKNREIRAHEAGGGA